MKNIHQSGELDATATCKDILQVQKKRRQPLPPAWEAEIVRRLKAVEDGTVAPVPFDDSLCRAYARIANLHAADAQPHT